MGVAPHWAALQDEQIIYTQRRGSRALLKICSAFLKANEQLRKLDYAYCGEVGCVKLKPNEGWTLTVLNGPWHLGIEHSQSLRFSPSASLVSMTKRVLLLQRSCFFLYLLQAGNPIISRRIVQVFLPLVVYRSCLWKLWDPLFNLLCQQGKAQI